MKFFADTANVEEINYCFSRGVNDGITTNPKIIESTGDLSLGFEGACKAILKRYFQVPVSLETDLGGMDIKEITDSPEKVKDILLSQAYKLASWGNNVVIKIPVCKGGLLAVEELAKKEIKTNVTACMTPYQALEAAKIGATYVSLFSNRMVDSHIIDLAGYSLEEIITNPQWKEIIKSNKEKYLEEAWSRTLNQIAYVAEELESTSSQLIVGSIRSSEDIYKLVKAEPQVITIPPAIVKELENIESLKHTKRSFKASNFYFGNSLYHPMTSYTLEEFEKAADSYRQYNKNFLKI